MRGSIEPRPGKNGAINSYRLTVSLGNHGGARERYRETVRGNRAQAERRLRQLLTELDNGQFRDPRKAGTVSEVLEAWLMHQRSRAVVTGKPRERTLQVYESHVRNLVEPHIGASDAARLTPEDIERFHVKVASEKSRTGQKLSGQTVLHAHRVLSQALKWAVRMNRIKSNPCDFVHAPSPRRRPPKIITPQQAQAIFAEMGKSENHDSGISSVAAKLCLLTGLRRSEALGLQWGDVDWRRCRIRVSRAYVQLAKGAVLEDTKTDRSRRDAAIDPRGLDMLRDWRDATDTEAEKIGRSVEDSDFIFANVLGEPIQPNSLTKAFGRACKRIGVNGVTFHHLRHAFATTAIENGVPLTFVQTQLGHTSIRTTADRYGHADPSFNQVAAEAVGTHFAMSLSEPASTD